MFLLQARKKRKKEERLLLRLVGMSRQRVPRRKGKRKGELVSSHS
jgi:hypothetical protein